MKKNCYSPLFTVWLLLTITLHVAYAQNYPENPWGEEWEHIYDGLDQSTAFSITDEKNVLIINCNIHDVKFSDETQTVAFQLYPNPVIDGILNIDFKAIDQQFNHITLVDIQGKPDSW